jgi:hypothetical protein
VLTDHAGTVHLEAGNFVLECTLRGALDIQHGYWRGSRDGSRARSLSPAARASS